jgi:hypothetical protein
MIYVENDFYSNFNSVAKANDDVSMRSILVDQISSVVANRKDELIDLFGKVNIKIKKNPTNKDLVNAIVTNLKTNKKLVVGLGYLIAKENDILQGQGKNDRTSEMYGGFGGEKKAKVDPKTKKPVDWNKGADAVTSVAGAISTFADTLTNIKQGGLIDDITSQANVKTPEQLVQEKKEADAKALADKKKKRNKTIIISVLVIGAIILGVLYAKKKGLIGKVSE